MITPTTIKIQFPEFIDIPDVVIQEYIDQCQFLVSANFFEGEINGKKLIDIAQSYFVASNLYTQVLKNLDMATGAPLTSRSAGQTSVSLGINSIDADNADALLMSNKYGQQYLMLRNSMGGVVSTTGGGYSTASYSAFL